MPLIEGIGDEVVQFAAAVLLIAVSTLAWWSTNARPDRYRSVVVMRSQTQHPVSVSIRTGEASVFTTSTRTARATIHASTAAAAVSLNPSPQSTGTNENRSVIPLQEMDSIIDADVALFNHSRMHFYRRVEYQNEGQNAPRREESSESDSEAEPTETPAEVDAILPASTEQMREMDSIVNAMRGDVQAPSFRAAGDGNVNTNTTPATKKVGNSEDSPLSTDEEASMDSEEANRRILIKLKYLNDTQKEVEGRLDELLKDFKWRHFSKELTEQSLVRLIYRGRVLEEACTLRACGLTNRAVVHALVHPRRAPPTQGQQPMRVTEDSIGAPIEIVHERAQGERAWDLENILMTLVSVALTVVWFFRCEYSNMFTASASVALFGLTVFYSVAIFGLYISDTFHLDRRQAQPQPPILTN